MRAVLKGFMRMMEGRIMSKLMEKITLRGMTVKNRAVRSAVHSFLGNRDGSMSEAEYRMYEELAANDIGLIVTGHCSVSPNGMANEDQTAIYADTFIGQLKRLRDVVHPYGAKLVAQINHAGPRAVHNDDLAGVSARELKKGKRARALSLDEIAVVRSQFIDAAYRVKRAGLDGVQLHAAHSYLLSQFLDETFNKREDAYGGTAENRFRLLREIIEGIRETCGDDFPVLVKINNDTATNDAQYERSMIYMLSEFRRLGVAAAELSGYDFLSQPKTATAYYLPRAKKLRNAVDLPLILVGGMRSLADMNRALDAGIDMVSLGRPLICEPDLLPKLLSGREKSQCINCNRCFVLPKVKPGVRCALKRARREK